MEGYTNYFKTAAINHKLLKHRDDGEKHFVESNLGEFENNLHNELRYPALILADESLSGLNEFANMRWDIIGSFMIVDKPDDLNHYAEVKSKRDACLAIAKQICAKMAKDRKLYNQGDKRFWIEGLDIKSFKVRRLAGDWQPLVGAMVVFGYNETAQRFDEDDWDNENDYRSTL